MLNKTAAILLGTAALRFLAMFNTLPVNAQSTDTQTIEIATWNIQNLKIDSRTTEQLRSLSDYANQLDADIIALQEVEGETVADDIFNPDEYQFFFSERNHPQRTGFAVRRGLQVVQNDDFVALSTAGSNRNNEDLRRGTDITVTVDGQDIRLLSVHLKSGCFAQQLSTNNGNDCRKLKAQIPILESWIDDRAASNTPFIVLGDFNRRFDTAGDEFWPDIDDGMPTNADLSRVTEGLESGCWVGTFPPTFIDHIVLDSLTTEWLVEDSFEQVIFTEANTRENRNVLSDHCPISVELDVDSVASRDPWQDVLDRIEAVEQELEELRQLIETNR